MTVTTLVPRLPHRSWRLAAWLLLSLALAGCNRSGCAPTAAADRLNIVVVLADALRAASMPLYGYPRPTTPHLDALARESVVFDQHLAHYPGTSVSVSQMQTGRLMAPLLVSYKYIAVPVRAIPADLLVLPEALQRAGYFTGVVSSHYWFREDTELLRHFDSRAIVLPTADHSYAYFEELGPALTTFLDAAGEKGQPFYLYVHALDTHGPYQYHSGFDQYEDADGWPEAYNRYDSEIMYTDHWVGRFVDELRQRHLLDRTVFVFTADHGEQFNEVGPEPWNSHHGPLVPRALVHVPLIIRFPGDPTPGRRYTAVTRHIDLAPTLLHLAAARTDLTPYQLDGEDLSGELRTGGTGAAANRTSIAFSPRYWGIYTRDREVHYDQWTDSFSPLYRPSPDAFNYPRLTVEEDPVTRDRLIAELREAYRDRTREFLELPENPALPQPALLTALLPVHPGTPSVPRFENLADDDRWAAMASGLEAQPGERLAPLHLATPWVAGTYRVTVVLYSTPIRERGYQNEFTLFFPGPGNVPAHLSGASANGRTELDAGVQHLGRELEIQISDPSGGVAIAGFKFERVEAAVPTASPDDALKERLRALGYVHD